MNQHISSYYIPYMDMPYTESGSSYVLQNGNSVSCFLQNRCFQLFHLPFKMSVIQKPDQPGLHVFVAFCILAEFKKFLIFRTVSDVYCTNVVGIILIATASTFEELTVNYAAVFCITIAADWACLTCKIWRYLYIVISIPVEFRHELLLQSSTGKCRQITIQSVRLFKFSDIQQFKHSQNIMCDT